MADAEVMRAGAGDAAAGSMAESHEHATPEFDDVGEEYLAVAMLRLIRSNRDVQRAILSVVMSCPNVKREC
jgi:hypothetical protein